jgi:membrane carboxypeptidase/penicillin-binding protein
MWKPFVVLAAIGDPESGVTAATRIDDTPLRISSGAGEWNPQNSDERYHGPVSVRQALARSLNVPTVRLAQRVGIDELADFGDRIGIRDEPLPRLPSMALGAFEASLYDVTAAYSVFPGSGLRVEPFAVAAVKAPSGVVLYEAEPREHVIASPAAAFVVHSMLEDVVEQGTARAIASAGIRSSIAGKTGTSSDQRDAWFVGYTPSLLLGVWVGFDDDRPLRGGAAEIAVPLWARIARRALDGAPPEPFRNPGGVEEVAVDADTGLRAAPECGAAERELFVSGTAPVASCGSGEPVASEARVAPTRGAPARFRDLIGDITAGVPRLMRSLFDGESAAPAGG